MENFTEQKNTLGLYDPQFEHDACGIGAVVDIKGRKSHQTVDDALSIVERLEHRAGKDAEGKTGDGVGIMLQISHKFFSKVAEELNISLGNEREYGVGMFFFPQSEHLRAQAMKLFEVVTRKEGLEFLAWRKVPVNPDAVGQKARDCMPAIWQCFIKKPAKVSKGIDFDRKLYIVRRVFEQASNGTYVPSLSSRTIVYKGMFLVHDLRLFYLDLQDEDYESAIGMVHSRFSTNTNPSWMRAHAVAGLALGILTGAVLQTLHDAQGIADRLMALAALDVHHSADAAGIVLELRVIQAKRRGVFRKLIHCLSHPYLSKYPLGRGTIRSLLHRKQKKRPRRVDFTLLERLCSGTYNYTER